MPRKLTILLAEDDSNDAYLLRYAFQKAGLPYHIAHVRDGQEAVDYLTSAPPFSDALQYPPPHLLLLDLKMPRMSGFDVLVWLSSRPDLRHLPVVILSSSNQETDIARAKELGAADYQIKPPDLEGLVQLACDLNERWITPHETNHARADTLPAT